jgi:predicted CoA-substrate-specific enzyme activase
LIGYTCKYAPVELLQALGGQCVFIDEEIPDSEGDNDIARLRAIKYARQLLLKCRDSGIKELVITGCSDISQRAYDILRVGNDFRFLFYFDLPYMGDRMAAMQFKGELIRFMQEYSSYHGEDLLMEDFLKRFAFAFTGEEKMASSKCGFIRHLDMPEGQLTFDELMEWYAGELLAQEPCVRMGGVIESESAAEAEAEESETEAAGQENIEEVPEVTEVQEEEPQTAAEDLPVENAGAEEASDDEEEETGEIFGGADIGYSFTKAVIVSSSGKVCGRACVPSTGDAGLDVLKAFGMIHDESGINVEDITAVTACGEGADKVDFVTDVKSGRECMIEGALKSVPDARTVLDAGAHANRLYTLGKRGELKQSVYASECAGAAGKFLEMTAAELQIGLDEMSSLGQEWEEELKLSGTCAVFEMSEIKAMAVRNLAYADIIHAADAAYAARISEIMAKARVKAPVVIAGGAAEDLAAVRAIEDKTGIELIIADEPKYCCALGAALLAAAR